MINRISFLATLFIGTLLSCQRSYEEVIDYVSYYDDDHQAKKVDGSFYNGREIGQWIFYSEDGQEIKKGSYVNGLQNGQWEYRFPSIDSTLVWTPITLDSLELSLPGTFVLRQIASENHSKVFQDTLDNTILAISLVDSCNDRCVAEYYGSTLNEFAIQDNQVIFSQSTTVKSKMRTFYIDEFLIQRPDYDNEIKQYMAYIPVEDEAIIVITTTNQRKYDEYIRFLVGEVFYHIRYNGERLAFPYEDLLSTPSKFR